MKYFIISDIHGSALWCRRGLAAFEKEQADRILCLGDILYHGPRNDLPEEYNPKAVIAMLTKYADRMLCVRGNCDTEVDQMVLPFPIMADYALIAAGSRLMFATHGHKFNESGLPPMKNGDILLHGHTHVPVCREIPLPNGTALLCNPGSASIPKEGSAHSYMIYDGETGTLCWKGIPEEGQSLCRAYMTHTL